MRPAFRSSQRAVASLAGLLLALPATAPAERFGTLAVPVYAYILPDGSAGEVCESACLQRVAQKVKGRRGVKKVVVEEKEIKVQIEAGVFRSAEVIKGIDGMKVEMRLAYDHVEVRFVDGAQFPPITHLDGDVLVVEMGENVRGAIEQATRFKLPTRMRCVGKLSGPDSNDAILARYEAEKRRPVTMVPFTAEADMDGDKRPDLYLRFTGLPELVLFNKPGGLQAVKVEAHADEELPRCDQTPTRFVRGIPKGKVKCLSGEKSAVGDAVERVAFNRSADLLMWNSKGFSTCEPFGEGAMPPEEITVGFEERRAVADAARKAAAAKAYREGKAAEKAAQDAAKGGGN